MYKLFEKFLQAMRSNFQRISRATKGEQSVEDLQQQSFLIAHEIGDKRGLPVDFADPADQELIMRYVNVRNLKRGDWTLRKSARISDEYEEDSSGPVFSIAAAESSDPLKAILAEENTNERIENLLEKSYSQATAYLLTFEHFNYDASSVGNYLAIGMASLKLRMINAREIMSRQPSLFDRVVKMDRSFVPRAGLERKPFVVSQNIYNGQMQWDFA